MSYALRAVTSSKLVWRRRFAFAEYYAGIARVRRRGRRRYTRRRDAPLQIDGGDAAGTPTRRRGRRRHTFGLIPLHIPTGRGCCSIRGRSCLSATVRGSQPSAFRRASDIGG